MLTGNLSRILETSPRGLETLRGQTPGRSRSSNGQTIGLRQAVSTPGKIGTVTSAVRYLAKAVLTGNVSTIVETLPVSTAFAR